MARLTITCIVRRFCLDCQGASAKAVHECADVDCALWEYREAAPSASAGPLTATPTATTSGAGNTAAASAPPDFDSPAGNVIGVGAAASPARSLADANSTAVDSSANTSADSDKADAASGSGHSPRKAARRAVLRAVRRHCLLCAASRADVRTCDARECGLWSYRFGVYPETYRAVRQRFLRPKTLSLF